MNLIHSIEKFKIYHTLIFLKFFSFIMMDHEQARINVVKDYDVWPLELTCSIYKSNQIGFLLSIMKDTGKDN